MAIIVVFVIVVIAAGVVLAAESRSSTLHITVTSKHVTSNVDYILTLDGRQVGSGTLVPGQSLWETVQLTWWVDRCQSHTVVATSTGDVFGPDTDTSVGVVCSGVPASMDLHI